MRKVMVFMPSLAGGGAERVTLQMCEGFLARGIEVSLVVGTSAGPLNDSVPAGLTVHDLGASHTVTAGPALARLVRRDRPDVVISAISHASIVATLAVRFTRRRPRLVVVHHNTTSLSTRGTPRRRDRLIPFLCGVAYRFADRVVAVSQGVATDLAHSSRLPVARIQVIPNPIEYGRIRQQADRTDDAVTTPVGQPVIVAAGRLEPQKRFDLLLRAFAGVTGRGHLVVLGDGTLRDELAALRDELGLADRVTLAGFTPNPYATFARADVFVLSSQFEGLPTVLLECLAFPLRIVSTDCPSGPDEILAGVEGAELVPVGDVAALTAGIERALSAGRLPAPRPDWQAYDSPRVIDRLAAMVEEVADAR